MIPEELGRWQWADLLDAEGYEALSRSLRMQAQIQQLVAESADLLSRAQKHPQACDQKNDGEQVLAGDLLAAGDVSAFRELARLMAEKDSPPIGNAAVPQRLAEQYVPEVLSMLSLPDNAMLLNAILQYPTESTDANALEWAAVKSLPSYDSLQGFWSSRASRQLRRRTPGLARRHRQSEII